MNINDIRHELEINNFPDGRTLKYNLPLYDFGSMKFQMTP
jgi:hypothetical protein